MIKMSSKHLLFRHVLPFFLSIPLLGGCNAFLPRDSGSTTLPPLSSTTTEKYVKAHRVYDVLYDHDGCYEASFVLDDFPGLSFERSEEISKYVSVTGNEDLIYLESIYYGDVNGDGHQDLCYTKKVFPGSSSHLEMRACIYDYFNDRIIFDSGTEGSFVLDLDDDGNLVLEEMGGVFRDGSGFSQLLQSARFLLAPEVQLEQFNLDFKIKAVSLEPDHELSNPVTGGFNLKANEESRVAIWINCIGQENTLTTDSINVECDCDAFSYTLSPKYRDVNPLFEMACRCNSRAEFNLKVSIGDAADEKKVVVA